MARAVPFAGLSRRRQLVRLRRTAVSALPRFGIEPTTDVRALRLVTFDFNATYRVDTFDGLSFALRINVNSIRPVGEVAGEVAWVGALADDSPVRVPRPLPPVEPAPTVRCDGIDRDLAVVAYEWLPAPNLGERASLRQVRELGRASARLHDHTQAWTPPDPVDRPLVTSWLMDSTDHLRTLDRPWWTEPIRAPVEEGARVDDVLAPVFRGAPQLVHADLHGWNAKWMDGAIAVFDFDDCAFTVPVFDLAISAFYLRVRPDRETAFLDGYASVRELPPCADDQWEALLASRSLLLLNDVVSSTTSYGADFEPEYARRTARRMRHYLDTGRFALDPP